jgi:putative SOS response-associated peptidase YedK
MMLEGSPLMCGRTALTASPEDLRETFGLDETPEVAPHYNVPPSRPLEVVRVIRSGERAGARRLDALRWGLVPTWAKDPKMGHRLVLARAETVATTPAFRDAFRWRRCLVAVDGFFEWRRDGKTATVPFFVRRPDRRVFALAGLWSRWVSPDGEVIESCAVVTQASRGPIAAIHDRQPVVLEPDAWSQWLDPAITDGAALAPLLEPRSPDLVAYSVSPYVNDPRHDDAKCIEPELAAQQALF